MSTNPAAIVRKDEYRAKLPKNGASIDANATVVCGSTIGRYAFIGAGAVVIRDVPDHALVVGDPGKIVGWVCTCGNRIRIDDAASGRCVDCGREYDRVDGIVAPTNAAHVATPVA